MKQLSNTRAILICLVILGIFSSFAQNEYGFGVILRWCNAFFCLTFFLECLVVVFRRDMYGWEKAGRITEALALFLLFGGVFGKTMQWMGSGSAVIIGGGIIFLFYLVGGIRFFVSNRKSGMGASFMTMFIHIIAAVGFLALLFKQQHWPLTGILFMVTGIFSAMILLLAIVSRFVKSRNDRLTIMQLASRAKGNLPFSFIYVSIWALYIGAVFGGIAPPLFTLQNPPAYQQMIEDGNYQRGVQTYGYKYDSLVNVYYDNYEKFIWNRHDEQMEKQ